MQELQILPDTGETKPEYGQAGYDLQCLVS